MFNTKVLARAGAVIETVPETHAAILAHWAGMIRSGEIVRHKETALDGDFKTGIVEGVLGYRPAGHADGQTVDKEHPIGAGRVDLALGRFGGGSDEVVAPFELKGAGTRDLDAPMQGRNITPVEQAWDYALLTGRTVRWVLVTNYVEIRLYSYREGARDYERFDIARLGEMDEYRRFVTLLHADNLLTGRTEELLRESLEADKEIGNAFYANYQDVRERLITEIAATGDGNREPHAPESVVSMAQTIMDRVLFIAFAEDRQLLPANLLRHVTAAANEFAPVPKWDNYLGLFSMIDGGGTVTIRGRPQTISAYNGGLFRRDPAIRSLKLSDEACAGLGTIGNYDFAEDVDVTILGHIFEQSLRDLEKHLAIARGEDEGDFRSLGRSHSKIKKDGIVYTPSFVARFITERTLGAQVRDTFQTVMREHAVAGDPSEYDTLRFEGRKGSAKARKNELAAWRAYLDRLQHLRVVDPACGSGIFLVTAFDWLRAEYDRANAKIAELRGDANAPDLFDIDSEILSKNLYGVDVNAESVEITKLSLWLKTAKSGKPLDGLDHTIRVGDSLIEDANYAYLDHCFTWAEAFPEVFDPDEGEAGFDVVLGNPPYVRMELIRAMKPYLETRYEVVSDRADLYCYFYERGLRLLRRGKNAGRLGYISSNTFFKTGSGAPLRRYLAREATIETVADFGDLQIFQGVTTYPVIMIARAGEPEEDHEISYWDVPAVPDTEFGGAFDAGALPYPQGALGEGSWELESTALRELRAKIMGNHPTLQEVYGAPLYGIKTGLNAAFVIDRATRDRLVAADPRSEKLLRPWLEGKDMRRWRVEPRDLFIIYIPKNRISIDDYPAIRNHLAPFREWEERTKSGNVVMKGLEHRATEQEWFELQQAQEAYVPALEKAKIAYRDVADECAFSLDRSGSFVDSTCFFVPNDSEILLAFLNSRVVWFLMKALTPEFRGGFARFKSQFVGTIPIPDALLSNLELGTLSCTAQSAAANRLTQQTAVTRRIPDLCPPNQRETDGSVKLGRKLEEWWKLDFPAFRAEIKRRFKSDIPLADRSDWEDWLETSRREINEQTAAITAAEHEIDALIYRLFDLTDGEIALLETNT
nr:DNA methyltransferase [Afifella marina]